MVYDCHFFGQLATNCEKLATKLQCVRNDGEEFLPSISHILAFLTYTGSFLIVNLDHKVFFYK